MLRAARSFIPVFICTYDADISVIVDLNGGMYMNNASNARLLTDLILLEPNLLPNMPSLAEALAVYASSTLIAGSLSSTYSLDWPYGKDEHLLPGDGVYENFNATYRTQQYISAPQPDLGMPLRILYFTVLVLVLVLSLVCVWYHILGRRMVTDFTDPQNLFTLAINSPPSRMLQVGNILFFLSITRYGHTCIAPSMHHKNTLTEDARAPVVAGPSGGIWASHSEWRIPRPRTTTSLRMQRTRRSGRLRSESRGSHTVRWAARSTCSLRGPTRKATRD